MICTSYEWRAAQGVRLFGSPPRQQFSIPDGVLALPLQLHAVASGSAAQAQSLRVAAGTIRVSIRAAEHDGRPGDSP